MTHFLTATDAHWKWFAIVATLVVSLVPGRWCSSPACFASFVAMLVAAFWRDWPTWFAPHYHPPAWIKAPNKQSLDAYTLLFNGGYRALESTMFSILAFYIVSAAY